MPPGLDDGFQQLRLDLLLLVGKARKRGTVGGCHRLIVGLLFAGKTPPPPSPQATLAGNLRKQVRRHNPWASPGVTVNKHQSASWDVLPAT